MQAGVLERQGTNPHVSAAPGDSQGRQDSGHRKSTEGVAPGQGRGNASHGPTEHRAGTDTPKGTPAVRDAWGPDQRRVNDAEVRGDRKRGDHGGHLGRCPEERHLAGRWGSDKQLRGAQGPEERGPSNGGGESRGFQQPCLQVRGKAEPGLPGCPGGGGGRAERCFRARRGSQCCRRGKGRRWRACPHPMGSTAEWKGRKLPEGEEVDKSAGPGSAQLGLRSCEVLPSEQVPGADRDRVYLCL